MGDRERCHHENAMDHSAGLRPLVAPESLVDIHRQGRRETHELAHEPDRCGKPPACCGSDGGRLCREERGRGSPSPDPELAKRGSIEVTAKLVEIPEGAIFERELYNYATVLKYQVLEVHRGKVKGQTIYVGHYNPFKPRSEAADRRVHGRRRQSQVVPRRRRAPHGTGRIHA